ncbi:uncharacterized protein [Amphiura filiformis]|uniref:uncharacterized protein n=1 Tax=Amphiura filiformis TaxID=82378 RepID=UPI003B22217B
MAFVEKTQIATETSKMKTAEQLRISESQIDQLERENARLADQLKEVIRMNSHWQRYDAQREEYVLKLTRTNHELQDKVEDLQSRMEALNIPKESERKETSRKTDQACGGDDDLQALRKEEEVAALVDRIAKLKDRIAELEKRRDTSKKEEDDQIAMLHEQVNVCVEDFKQERKDRERIHGENLKLRKRLALAEKQINVYEEKIVQLHQCKQYRPEMVSKPPPRVGYDEPDPEDRPHRLRASNAARYQQPMYYGDDLTDLPGDVEIDGGVPDEKQEETPDIPINGVDSLTEADTEDVDDEEVTSSLQCPRCMASFEEDTDFMKHVDKCID